MLRSIVLSALIATTAAGCYTEEPDAVYAGSYGYGSPDLVDVGPGVQVIADYDYPVFYSDGFYWRYDGGLWYRSGYWNGGWGVAYNVPYGVRGIRNPGAYSHWGGVRDHRGFARGGGGYVDHRGGFTARGGYRAAPARARGGGGSRGGGGGHRR
jgi:hypothetical protein